MKFKDIYEQIRDLEGWMGVRDCRVLYDYSKNLTGLIVEIGSFMGRSTKVMALASKAHVIAIDPYIKVHKSLGHLKPLEVRDRFLRAVRGLDVELIKDRSCHVGKTWNRPIDLLHLDGNHKYKNVVKDIELFVPWVKKGHHIIFHDYPVGFGPADEGKFVSKAVHDNKDLFSKILALERFAVCTKK